MKIKLFTHTDLDGVGAAVLAYLMFGIENVNVEYCDYNDINEKVEKLLSNIEDRCVYDTIFITDISIDAELADAIRVWICPCNVLLFDHHPTALYLNDYYWCKVQIESDTGLKTCGTEMFFQYLYDYGYFKKCDPVILDNIRKFVEIVRDYDTWRWRELGYDGFIAKQVNDLFSIYGREEFINWAIDRIYAVRDEFHEFPCFRSVDRILLEQRQKEIDSYVEQKDKQLRVSKDPFGNVFGYVFSERYFSELGNRLCGLHPELDYVAMIDISSGKVSYRTCKESVDVGGEIAHSFGGGGHKKAAGSRFDAEEAGDYILRHSIMFQKSKTILESRENL